MKKTPAKRAAPKKAVKPEPKAEETSASDYFASSTKKTPAAKAKPAPEPKATTPKKAAAKPTSTRTTPRKSAQTNSYKRADEDDADAYMDEDDKDAGDDIFSADVKTAGRRKDDNYMEVDSESDGFNKSQTKKISEAGIVRAKKAHDPATNFSRLLEIYRTIAER